MSSHPFTGGIAVENLTVLDFFAMIAMHRLLNNENMSIEDISKKAYDMATEMIKERERKC